MNMQRFLTANASTGVDSLFVVLYNKQPQTLHASFSGEKCVGAVF